MNSITKEQWKTAIETYDLKDTKRDQSIIDQSKYNKYHGRGTQKVKNIPHKKEPVLDNVIE